METVSTPGVPTYYIADPPGAGVSSVSATPSAGTINDYAPVGYVGGTTNRLILTPGVGGTTINGIVAATDGWTVLVQNASTTELLTFAHLAVGSSSANRFSNANGESVTLPPLGAARMTYVTNQWQFA